MLKSKCKTRLECSYFFMHIEINKNDIFLVKMIFMKKFFTNLRFAKRYTGDSGANVMADMKAKIGTIGAKMAI